MGSTVTDMAGAYKNALIAASVSAVADDEVLVCYGHPGDPETMPDDVVSVGRITAVIDFATITSNRGTRDVDLTAWVTVSCFEPGGFEAEQLAGDRAYQWLNRIEEYVRVTDPTLGGLVRWCMCSGHDSNGITDPEVLAAAKGREIEIIATFVAKGRITS